jgi:hypothetical protein
VVNACLFRFRRKKQEARIEIGEQLVRHLLDAVAAAPPTAGIVVGVRQGDDAYLEILAECHLKEQPGAPGVGIFGHHVQAADIRTMLAQPVPQRHGRALRPIAVRDGRGNRLDAIVREALTPQGAGGVGRQRRMVSGVAAAGSWSTRSHDQFVGTGAILLGGGPNGGWI